MIRSDSRFAARLDFTDRAGAAAVDFGRHPSEIDLSRCRGCIEEWSIIHDSAPGQAEKGVQPDGEGSGAARGPISMERTGRRRVPLVAIGSPASDEYRRQFESTPDRSSNAILLGKPDACRLGYRCTARAQRARRRRGRGPANFFSETDAGTAGPPRLGDLRSQRRERRAAAADHQLQQAHAAIWQRRRCAHSDRWHTADLPRSAHWMETTRFTGGRRATDGDSRRARATRRPTAEEGAATGIQPTAARGHATQNAAAATARSGRGGGHGHGALTAALIAETLCAELYAPALAA